MAVEKDLSPARVEAFSDGVIAIIITIMVLELHVPQDHTLNGLLGLWQTFASYALSYLLVAIYWINHHHLFSMVKRVDLGILWSNILLLFVLSLVPFFTAFVGQSKGSPFAVLLYAGIMFSGGLSFMVLKVAIARAQAHGNHVVRIESRRNFLQPREAADQKSRADQQKQGELQKDHSTARQ